MSTTASTNTDDIIERLAKAMFRKWEKTCARLPRTAHSKWDDQTDEFKNVWRGYAEAALGEMGGVVDLSDLPEWKDPVLENGQLRRNPPPLGIINFLTTYSFKDDDGPTWWAVSINGELFKIRRRI
jgi:hypothetical protein